MSKAEVQIRDAGSERARLGTILKHGKNALLDADGIVGIDDFSLPINRAIFTTLQSLADDPSCNHFDIETIKMKANAVGLQDYFSNPKDIEYLELLTTTSFNANNVPLFAYQIKKFSVIRDLYKNYSTACNYLLGLTGNESLSEIIRNAEGKVLDYMSGADNEELLVPIGQDIEDKVVELIASGPVDQVGLPTGFTLLDRAIGGGPRPGTVTIVGGRAKCAKSWFAINIARNVSKRGIPVLYLDTELTRDYQQNRLLSIESGVPIFLLETGKFKQNPEFIKGLKSSQQDILKLPFTYQSVAGMSHEEALAVARRWLVKNVGFNNKGKANPCLIVYDYLKLTSGDKLSSHTPEYILLGLMLTEMHNFAVKYNIPIFGFVQLNREGIDNEDTSIVAGSDRILWLCSSLSILKNKDDNDVSLGCGLEHGNKKLIVLETRHGSGLEISHDYINIHASLRPGINEYNATGHMREGFKFSEVCSGPTQVNQGVSPKRDTQPTQRPS